MNPVPLEKTGAPPELVEAGMLILRRVRAEDVGAIAAAVGASLDHLRPWMAWAVPEAADPRTQRVRVMEADEMWAAGTDYIYSVITADEGTLVGAIGMHRRIGDGGIEIGYWTAVQQTRRGFATAAAEALTSVALGMPGVTRVEIHCDEANIASNAIPRKLGYRLDRIDDHEPEAPGERGRRLIWVRESAVPGSAEAGE
jgi:RimJ/RimL family protein N-acetyltransferase